MAFFKMRKGGEESPATRRPAESIEAIRKRARHRLIGAGVLVLLGVLGFPLLFDTQPRPIAVDIPIEIPDRDKAKPLQAPRPANAAPAVSGAVTPAPAAVAQVPAPVSSVAAVPVPVKEAPPALAAPESKVEAVAAAKPEAKPEPKPEAKAEPKPPAKADAKVADAGSAKAAPPPGKTVAAAASQARYVVQVGAFADAAKARAARAKVERAGLKTYTHVAETKDGKRIRVRVGPFETRGEADKAASKIKGLDMPAAILTL